MADGFIRIVDSAMRHRGSRTPSGSPRAETCRRLAFILAAALIMAGLSPVSLYSSEGWQGDLRLTNDPESSFPPPNNCKYIAVDGGGRLHIVWPDSRDRNYEIYHKFRSEGVWSADTRLTFDSGDSKRPNLIVDVLGRIHLVWNDDRDGNMEIYHRMWNGSWGPENRVSFTGGDSYASSLAANGFDIHMVYQEEVSGFLQIIYRHFDLFLWSDPEQLSFVESGMAMVPSVAAGPDGSVHVAWWDTREDPGGTAKGKIYYREKSPGWSEEEIISGPLADAMRPNIVVDDSGYVHVAWIDKRVPFEQIYYRRFGPGGWEDEVCLTTGEYTHYHPSLSCGGRLHLVYWANYPSAANPGVFYMDNDGTSWNTPVRISSESSRASLCSIAAEKDGILHVAWKDDRDANEEIYYNTYLPPGTAVGEKNDLPGPLPEDLPLTIHASPNPFRGITTIMLGIPEELKVDIRIYDITGRVVRQIAARSCPQGTHPFAWDGRDDSGSKVAGGVYIAMARAGKMSVSSKILLLQ